MNEHQAKGLEDQALEADVLRKTKAAKKRAAKRSQAAAASKSAAAGKRKGRSRRADDDDDDEEEGGDEGEREQQEEEDDPIGAAGDITGEQEEPVSARASKPRREGKAVPQRKPAPLPKRGMCRPLRLSCIHLKGHRLTRSLIGRRKAVVESDDDDDF